VSCRLRYPFSVFRAEHAEGHIARLDRSGEVDTAPAACSDRTVAGPAGNRASSGGDDRARTGISRFTRTRQLMSYGGTVASEHFRGRKYPARERHRYRECSVRRVVVELSCAYRHWPNVGGTLRKRQKVFDKEVRKIARKAQRRLQTRYRKLTAREQQQGAGGDRDGARAVWFYLGHWDKDRSCAEPSRCAEC
jgi:hypothetical protein